MRTYNPLNVDELGRNAARALTNYPSAILPLGEMFDGAGVYTIHYRGTFPPYADIRDEEPIYCRWLILDLVWIGLTEQVLIAEYRPIWNVVVDGFGHHDQGTTRRNQKRSRWDTLHPGRPWAAHYQDNADSAEAIQEAILSHRKSKGCGQDA